MTAKFVYFFQADRYIRYDARRDVLDPPFTRRITDAWNRWPASFASGVDATVNWGDGTAFFFKGPNYLKYDVLANQVTSGVRHTRARSSTTGHAGPPRSPPASTPR